MVRLKIQYAVFVCLIFLAPIFSNRVYALGQAVVLTDEELDSIHAGGLRLDLNQVALELSAGALQSNTGILAALSGGVTNSSVHNANLSKVSNFGNSAVVAQSNIAAVVATTGDIVDVAVSNVNSAAVFNNFQLPVIPAAMTGEDVFAQPLAAFNPGVELNQLKAVKDDRSFGLNQGSVHNAAVALQSNLSVVAALEGDIKNVIIDNVNNAVVENLGGAAMAGQNNISVVVSQGGSIENVKINNLNTAAVKNMFPYEKTDTTSVVSMAVENGPVDLKINSVFNETAGVVTQANTSIVALINAPTGKSIKDVVVDNQNKGIAFNGTGGLFSKTNGIFGKNTPFSKTNGIFGKNTPFSKKNGMFSKGWLFKNAGGKFNIK
ncbi:hypothetical protein ACFL5X_01605 [Candidatus Omnitrophota bacterium]